MRRATDRGRTGAAWGGSYAVDGLLFAGKSEGRSRRSYLVARRGKPVRHGSHPRGPAGRALGPQHAHRIGVAEDAIGVVCATYLPEQRKRRIGALDLRGAKRKMLAPVQPR